MGYSQPDSRLKVLDAEQQIVCLKYIIDARGIIRDDPISKRHVICALARNLVDYKRCFN